jgi:hypothetical protein
MEKQWSMNETQTAFCKALKDNGGKATLFELNYFKGFNFKSGSVNTLIKKGIVKADEEVEYACDVIYNGVKVGSVKKSAKVYELVSND